MLGHFTAVVSVLAVTVTAQDYALDNSRRRVGGVDEDLYDYDYQYVNALPPLQPEPLAPQQVQPQPAAPPRKRIVGPPVQKSQYAGNNFNRGPPPQGLVGKEACQNRNAKNAAHESACDLYYDCYEGQGFLQSCPNGLVYNSNGRFGLIDSCDYPHNVDCSGRPERNPPQSTEHCDWLYGIFGHETSCTRYWTCWNGTATEQFCIGGLLYNEETHACDWPQNVAGCQKHPLCKDDANGNVPLGKSCNRYWACQGGYPRLQRCPAMLVFDKNRKRCVTPPTEDCEVPTTNAPPPEDQFDDLSGSGQRSPNPRRGGGGGGGSSNPRRGGNTGLRGGGQGQPISLDGPPLPDNLPFNIPAGASPLNQK